MTQPIDDDHFIHDDGTTRQCISAFGRNAGALIQTAVHGGIPESMGAMKSLRWHINELVRWCRHHNGERKRLQQENARYRRWFGCDSCGEDHTADAMCPPHEMRTTGMAWFKSAIRSAEADNQRLEQQVAAVQAENERLRKAIDIAADYLSDAIGMDWHEDHKISTAFKRLHEALSPQGANQPAEQAGEN